MFTVHFNKKCYFLNVHVLLVLLWLEAEQHRQETKIQLIPTFVKNRFIKNAITLRESQDWTKPFSQRVFPYFLLPSIIGTIPHRI